MVSDPVTVVANVTGILVVTVTGAHVVQVLSTVGIVHTCMGIRAAVVIMFTTPDVWAATCIYMAQSLKLG